MQTAAQISHRKGENKMKKLFMVCNAHLDPVWLWNWQEGAAAAIATFRTAADICEESEGFVFCHNEALFYSWVEEYEPALFQRIRQLVEAKKWHIMGGWYLQPDCNLPSGESILRQIIAGKRYFMEKFHAAPTVAVNFDTFGHSRGLVQILRKCGYTGYLFMRPGKELLELPSRNIRWRGFDGSEILAHRLDCSYGSAMGHAAQDAESWCRDEASESISLFTWGVGNHGGGPSRRDVAELDRWIHAQPQIQAVHSTPVAFFQALEDESVDAPVFADDLRPVFVGCYTAQARVKQLHRELENHLFAAEKLLTAAAVQGLIAYPSAQLHEAEQDLLFAEFHDILPGTTIQECEADSIGVLQHGLTTVSRLQMKGAMALLAGQPKAVPEPKTEYTVPADGGRYQELIAWKEICREVRSHDVMLGLTLQNETCCVYRGRDFFILCTEEQDRRDIADPKALEHIRRAFAAASPVRGDFTLQVVIGRKGDYLSDGSLYDHVETSDLFRFDDER